MTLSHRPNAWAVELKAKHARRLVDEIVVALESTDPEFRASRWKAQVAAEHLSGIIQNMDRYRSLQRAKRAQALLKGAKQHG